MSIQCRILNGICRLLYRGEYRRFMRVRDVAAVQEKYLKKLLWDNRNTRYGKRFGFEEITSYEEFVKKVPLTKYEDYEPYLDAIGKGEKQVLTGEDVLLFELTSGSSGGKKRIPYTPALKKEFQRGIKPWLYDLYASELKVTEGQSYWSVTPVTAKKAYTEGGIPLGFEEDAEYFGFLEQFIMRRMFAVDSGVKFAEDMDDFYLKTTKQLVECKELTLISVWNPTFLTLLCDYIREHLPLVTEGLSPERAEEVKRAVGENRFDRVFPKLKVISCWADGSAKDYLTDLEVRFPTVMIQPKGLLATECFISFPLLGEEGSRLSVRSHFFEFRNLKDGRIVTVEDLTPGEYEMIVTTGGGFYRYCIGDVIEVLQTEKMRPPRIRFLRRTGVASDLFGEKLTEEFVRNVCKALGISEEFCLLAPEGNRYCLYTTAQGLTDERLDAALREGYHYEYCRQLGQLLCAQVVSVAGEPQQCYIQRLTAEGMRMGDIKPAYLSKKSGWEEWFCGRKGDNLC